jgi:hypothetical protein
MGFRSFKYFTVLHGYVFDNGWGIWYNISMPQFDEETERRFRELVLREGVATVTFIRQEMSPVLDEYDDIPLIRRMLHILTKGEQDGDLLETT